MYAVDPPTSDILLFLPNLRFLTIQTSFVSGQGPARRLKLDLYLDMSILSELSLGVASVSFAEVASHMCLPRIRSLSFRGRIHKHLYGVQVPESYKPKCSGLRSLKFDWFMDEVSMGKLKLYSNYTRLLELPGSLATLSIKLRVTASGTHIRSAWDTVKVYPGAISACLEPVRSSLTELEVIALGGTSFKHEGTSLDLSAFGVLWNSLAQVVSPP